MSPIAVVESVLVKTAGIALSGLMCRPAGTARGLIVALPGGGIAASYWDCPPRPDLSLLRLGAQLGYFVLALDRPGYGASSAHPPEKLALASQTQYLFDAVEAWRSDERFRGPTFLIGHSIGGILTLMMSAHERGATLAGVDVLGVPFRFPATAAGEGVKSMQVVGGHVPIITRDVRQGLLFGPQGSYDEDAFEHDSTGSRPMPVAEYRDSLCAPSLWKDLFPAIRIPVQFTLAEFERMQVTGRDVLEEARALLYNSPHCLVHLQRGSGHNVSQHRIARAYHLRALAFFEECLALPHV